MVESWVLLPKMEVGKFLLIGALFISEVIRIISGVAIDNGVVGEPTISCGTEKISFWVRTRNIFVGKVYVKGEYGRPECTLTFTTRPPPTSASILESTPLSSTQRPLWCPPCPPCPAFDAQGPESHQERRSRQTPFRETLENIPEMAHLTVLMNTCNMRRERSLSHNVDIINEACGAGWDIRKPFTYWLKQLNPPGVTISFTAVVSFHHYFLTKVDKAYQIRCFYMEADKTVVSEIDVSMPQTTELTAQAAMPTCRYTIRRESENGPEIRFAKVGDKVFHRWECVPERVPTPFRMLVHSCYVGDGQSQNVQIIDEKGCSNDVFAIGDLTYKDNLLAYVEGHVFKFADRAVLDFQCAITICVGHDGECDGITPPDCGRARTKRDLVVGTVNRSLPLFDSDQPDQWNLHAQRLTVVDLDDNIQSEDLLMLEKQYSSAEDNALSVKSDKNLSQDMPVSPPTRRPGYHQRMLNDFAPSVCLTVVGFGVLVALCTFIFTLAAVILGTLFILRKRETC